MFILVYIQCVAYHGQHDLCIEESTCHALVNDFKIKEIELHEMFIFLSFPII